MRVGFTVAQQGEQVRVELRPPEGQGLEPLVHFARQGNLAGVLMGRLYYREERLQELCGRLHGDALAARAEGEAHLALAVYRAFGLPGLECLEGDFALAVWDGDAGKLVGLRDPMGGYPLYWVEARGGFALGTSLRPLLDWLGRRELSAEFLADFLMRSGPGEEAPTERCAYEGVHRVLPGTMVVVDTRARVARRHAFWDWQQHIQDPGVGPLDEWLARYTDQLRAAVRERLRGRTLAHLSGGMDSTGIALLARDLVRAGEAPGPLHTVSLVYERLPQLARERPYLEAVLGRETGFVAHRLPADDLLHYDSFRDAPPHDEPYTGLFAIQMDRAMFPLATEAGVSTVLTGHGADDIHDIHPYHLADLIRRGRLLKAWREAGRWARLHNSSRWGILGTFGLACTGWAWLRGGWWRRRTRLAEQNEFTVPPWILPAFAGRHDLARRARENGRRTYRRCPSTLLSMALSSLDSRPGDVLRACVSAPLGVQIAHPFLDSRLIAQGLGLLARLSPEPGRKKPLLARALRDVLPAEILGRRAKGCFDEINYQGLARNLRHLEDMVRAAPVEHLGVLDKGVLLRQLEEASLGGARAPQMVRLESSLALVKWLSLQEEARDPQGPRQVIQVGAPAPHLDLQECEP
jgi:asparagine synthase (glutamine-hydrolysing)